MMDAIAEPTAISTAFSAQFDSANIDRLVDRYADDATYMGPDVDQPIVGKDAIRETFRAYFRAFPDLSTQQKSSVQHGKRLIVEGTTSGTHTGEFETPRGTIAPTNARIEFDYVIVAILNDRGEISEDRTYFDMAGVLRQLGAINH